MKSVVLALSLLVAVSLACSGPECGSIVSGIRAEPWDSTNCSFIDINVNTGHLFRRVPFVGCTDTKVRTTGVPFTTYEIDGGYLYWISGKGANVYQIDASMVATQVWGSMPSTYDYVFGMNFNNGQGLFVATTSQLLYFADVENTASPKTSQSVMSFSSFQFSQKTIAIGDEWDPTLYIVDEATIVTLDLTDPLNPIVASRVKMNGLAFPTQLQVYATSDYATNQLLMLVANVFYIVDPVTGLYKAVGPAVSSVGKITATTIAYNILYYSDDVTFSYLDTFSGNVSFIGAFEGTTMSGSFIAHA